MVTKQQKKKIVIMGGGTGTYVLLTGLKKYLSQIDLSVVITMMDSGGSNRVIRDEFGLLPTSDIRQCMVALASEDSDQTLRKLFTYRYENGIGISGMTFGNLFMAALTDIYRGDQNKAIKETCDLLGVSGNIIPVTFDNTNLVAMYENGRQVLGEHFIDEPREELLGKKIVEVSVFPPAAANPVAVKAIKDADLIVLGPGDLYTSVISNLVVDGIGKAVGKAKAKKVYVMNLMTRVGQTEGYSASDHLTQIEKYLGGKKVDYCLVNNDKKLPKEALAWYKAVNTYPVKDDFNGNTKTKVIRTSLFDSTIYKKSKSDKLTRSLIRHDSAKLAKAIVDLL